MKVREIKQINRVWILHTCHSFNDVSPVVMFDLAILQHINYKRTWWFEMYLEKQICLVLFF